MSGPITTVDAHQSGFFHPALDVAPTRLASLVARADPHASELLRAAARLARDRMARDAALRHALVELDDPPFIGPFRTTYATPAHVTQTDLLRAIFGAEDAAIRALPFSGMPYDPSAHDELVSRSRALWMRAAGAGADAALDDGDLTLELPWGARHALDALTGGDAPLRGPANAESRPAAIDVASLMGALEPRAWRFLAERTHDYVEGLCTAEEAAERLCRPHLEHRLPPFSDVYFDRHGGIEALDSALRVQGMVWITGDEGAGRGALASAWITRVACRLGPPDLAGIRPGVAWHALGTGPGPDAFGPAHGVGPAAVFHLLVRPDDGQRRGPAIARAGDITLTGGAGALDKLTPDELRGILTALALRPDAARALILSTSQERELVCRAVPEAASIPVITIPPIADADRLLLWVAAGAHARLPGGALPQVASMVAAFAAATEAERTDRSPASIERALARGRAVMGDGAELILQALVGARRGRAPRPRERPVVERFLGSEARLRALVAFEKRWDQLTRS